MVSTIKHVAERANVSTKTVSRVINGDKYVRKETEKRILEAMKALRYRPDPVARSLRRGVTQTIGVIIGHGPDVVFSNPFFGEVLRGIGLATATAGYKVVLMTYSRDLTHGDLVSDRLVDGFILMSIQPDDPLVEYLEDRNMPFVHTTRHDSAPFVDVDNELGAHLAVSHLLQLGHRCIGLINGPPALRGSRDRFAGYRRALEEAGVPYREELTVSGTFSEDAGYEAVQHFLHLDQIPTALFITADLMAMGAMRGIHQYGLTIPDDISIVGFDGVSLGQYMTPPLTTISQRSDRKGVAAAQLLLGMVRGEEPRPRQITLPPELIVRQSTSPPRTRT